MRISQTSILKNKTFVWSEFLTLRCIRKGTTQTICEGAFSRKQQCRRALGFIFILCASPKCIWQLGRPAQQPHGDVERDPRHCAESRSFLCLCLTLIHEAFSKITSSCVTLKEVYRLKGNLCYFYTNRSQLLVDLLFLSTIWAPISVLHESYSCVSSL